jgi:phosphatidylethanolamine-binding protein (PEBP) family uncharacterized protein
MQNQEVSNTIINRENMPELKLQEPLPRQQVLPKLDFSSKPKETKAFTFKASPLVNPA